MGETSLSVAGKRRMGFRRWLGLLLLAFIVIPLAELAILIKIGNELGIPATLGIVVATGVIGSALAATQGLRAIRRIREEVLCGRMPAASIVDGVLLLAAGVLLITPGLITDAVGFFLLIPPGRRLVRELMRRWLQNKVRTYVHWEEQRWE